MKKIGLVLPAYNEATSIGEVLKDMPSTINDYAVRTIVVNDGSTDETISVVRRFKNVTLINHVLNSGAGAATRTGIDYAKSIGCTIVVTLDSDGQHHIEDVIKIAKHSMNNSSDLVIGSRLIAAKGMPWYKIIGNKGLSFITFIIFGVFVTDSQSGLKAFNKNALDKIRFHINDYAFCSEIIWQARKNKLKIEEIPVRAIYTDYSIAKGQSNWNGFNIIGHMLKRRIMGFING